MNKKFALFVIAFIFIGYVSAIESNLTYSSSSIVQIRSLKYEPYPVSPGEYFDLWIGVQYVGDSGSQNIVFELVPEYPFSLDPNENPIRDYGSLNSPSVVLDYKVRVASDAIEGVNKLKIKYRVGDAWYVKEFDIKIADAQTKFDAVIQEVSGQDVSLAIANIGKNTANSVIVKIPEQENYQAADVDGQMVGNLESGDYTIISFSLNPRQSKTTSSENRTTINSAKNLKFDIYYTDNIGERRVINMELPLRMTNTNSTMPFGNFAGRTYADQSGSSYPTWYYIVAVVIALIVFYIVARRNPRLYNKTFGLIFKKKSLKSEDPDWIKKINEKEKKR